MKTSLDPLADLIRAEPTVAPLARLYQVALKAADEDGWAAGLPTLAGARGPLGQAAVANGQPVLDGQTLHVDPSQLSVHLERLLGVLEAGGQAEARRLKQALTGGKSVINPVSLLEASLALDTTRVASLAAEAAVDSALLSTLGHLTALPLLLAWGQQTNRLLEGMGWQQGYCPTCGAWPSLAELRGLDREFWLRCGRCSAGWKFSGQQCVYCGNLDHTTQSYLAAEADRDARRAMICHACQNYLKAVATFGALSTIDVIVHDLRTIELDVAALERGYGRPAHAGTVLDVTVVAERRRAGWFGWGR